MSKKKKENEICSCFHIEKSDMKEAIKSGITKFKEYQEMSHIGTKCSSCKKKNKERFKKYKRKLEI